MNDGCDVENFTNSLESSNDDAPPKKKAKLNKPQEQEQKEKTPTYSMKDARCKVCCKRTVAPGVTQHGNPYDTCCRACAVGKGKGLLLDHSETCNMRFYGM